MGCCCVGSVAATRVVAVIGVLVSGLCMAPPVYVYLTEKDYSTLMPYLPTLQKLLEAQYEDKKITGPTMADQRKLLDDFAEHADILAIAVFVLGATNILLNSLLLIGSCCRVRCLVLLWLVVVMLEILVLGCPTVIFFSLLGVYFTTYHQLVAAAVAFSSPTVIVVAAVLVWFTVLAAHGALKKKNNNLDDVDTESTEPLMPGESVPGPGQAPPTNTSYNLGQYPQYYPHYPPTSHPTAPPQTTPQDKNNPSLYPTLPVN